MGSSRFPRKLIALDDVRKAAIAKSQAAQERRNAASKEIGAAMKAKDEAKAEALKAEVAGLKDALPVLEEEERQAIAALDKALAEIPNIPLPDVPFGKDENDNPELRKVGTPPKFSFQPKEHFDIGEALGLMDFETAAKISGARFVVLKGALARLERALAQFMLDLHTGEHGYMEVNPPLIVRDEAMFGTAQLPKFGTISFRLIGADRKSRSDDALRRNQAAALAASKLRSRRADTLFEEALRQVAARRGEKTCDLDANPSGRF